MVIKFVHTYQAFVRLIAILASHHTRYLSCSHILISIECSQISSKRIPISVRWYPSRGTFDPTRVFHRHISSVGLTHLSIYSIAIVFITIMIFFYRVDYFNNSQMILLLNELKRFVLFFFLSQYSESDYQKNSHRNESNHH